MGNEIKYYYNTISNKVFRIGVGSIILIISIILVSLFIIEYPEFIEAEIVIYSDTYHDEIVSKRNCKISDVFIKNQEMVKKGEIIASLNDNLDFKQYKTLKISLDDLTKSIIKYNELSFDGIYEELKKYNFIEMKNSLITSSLDGEDFIQSYYNLYNSLTATRSDVTLINIQIELGNLYSMLDLKSKIINIKNENFDIYNKQLVKSKELRDSGYFSNSEILEFQSNISSLKTDRINEKYYYLQLEGQINKLIIKRNEYKELSFKTNSEYISDFVIELLKMNKQITLWEESNLLKSMTDGTLNYINFRGVNQNVKSDEVLFAVVPPQYTDIIKGKVIVPFHNAVKIEVGNTVNVELYQYPALRYGTFPGMVQSKSSIYSNDNCYIYINIDRKNLTASQGVINLKNDMRGRAQIIIEKTTLINKISNNYSHSKS